MPKFKKGHTLGFKPGNVPHNKGVKREMVKDPPVPYMRLPVELNTVGREQEIPLQAASCHLLRPKKLKECVAGFSDRRAVKDSEDSCRFVDMEKNAETWNEVLKLHERGRPDCAGRLIWDLATEERHGRRSQVALRCEKCCYGSRLYNLL